MSYVPRRGLNLLIACVLVALAGGAVLHLVGRHAPAQGADLAALKLIDQDNVPRSLDDWRGQVVVLDFIYTGCGDTCPLKTAQLASVQAGLAPELRRRVHLVSVSVDPEHDDPAALRSYAARTGADLANWTFLTGDLAKVARFAAVFDAMPATGDEMPSHITTVRLLDRDGRVIHRYVGEPVNANRLANDIVASAMSPLAEK